MIRIHDSSSVSVKAKENCSPNGVHDRSVNESHRFLASTFLKDRLVAPEINV